MYAERIRPIRQAAEAPACAACPLAGLVYGPLRDTSASDISELRASYSRAKANADIVQAGQQSEFVRVLRSGWAYRYAVLDGGRRQILNFLIPGDVFDLDTLLLPGQPALFSTRSVTAVEICAFQAGPFQQLLRSTPALRQLHVAQIREHLWLNAMSIIDLGKRSALGRIARFVLGLEERLAKRGLVREGSFDWPITQEQLGDALGLTAIHVNRTLNALRENGVIAYCDKQMQIVDRRALVSITARE